MKLIDIDKINKIWEEECYGMCRYCPYQEEKEGKRICGLLNKKEDKDGDK